MTVYLQDDALQFALQAAGLPDAAANPYVAVWLQKGDKYRRLGFANAAEDGTLAAGGPSADLAAEFPQLYATYDRSSSRRRPRTPRTSRRASCSPASSPRAAASARAAASRGS